MELVACRTAARGGHLDLLQFLRHEQGFGWDSSVRAAAAWGGHSALDEWAAAHGCPAPGDSTEEEEEAEAEEAEHVEAETEWADEWADGDAEHSSSDD